MTTNQQRLDNLDYVLRFLLDERRDPSPLPPTLAGKQQLLRALMNVRPPKAVPDDVLLAQDHELSMQKADKGVVRPTAEGLSVWQGDITRLDVDAIVNAANAQLLGCFAPLHACIDNCIHSAAGMQLRNECAQLMQGADEPTGSARMTRGYNLPARHVIHTVGPIIDGDRPTPRQEAQLASCYRACMDIAEQNGLQSIAFCCISTGVFHFPNRRAAEIAVETVSRYPRRSLRTVVFNVFKDIDYDIYRQLV